MQQPATPTRRSVVTVGAATALGVAGVGTLAACGGSSSTASTTPAPAASAAGAAAIAKLADIPVGGAIAATLAGANIIVAQPTAGKVVAFSAVCTHQGCQVAPKGSTLNCPCHGSVFNASTGAVESGPAPAPLPAVNIKLSGTDVLPA